MSSPARRVVITGIGLVTPLGLDCATTWTRLISGRSGLIPLPEDHLAGLPGRGGKSVPRGVMHGGPAPALSLLPEQMTGEPIIDLATQAANEAIDDAGGTDKLDVDPVRADFEWILSRSLKENRFPGSSATVGCPDSASIANGCSSQAMFVSECHRNCQVFFCLFR
jgi:hypothetical protein